MFYRGFWLFVFLWSPNAFCLGIEDLPIDPSNFGLPTQLISDEITEALVKSFATIADHRPMEPASRMGSDSDLGLEVSLVRLPPNVEDALAQAQISSSAELPPAVPFPRLHFHQGLGVINLGVSFIGYSGLAIYGANIGVPILVPEEGPTLAIRGNYSKANLRIISTQSISAQCLLSKKMGFVDPYIGLGYQRISGTVSLSIDIPLPAPFDDQTIHFSESNTAQLNGYQGFIGVEMKWGPVPLELTLEMAYHSLGTHHVGAKFGFSY